MAVATTKPWAAMRLRLGSALIIFLFRVYGLGCPIPILIIQAYSFGFWM